MTTDYTDIVARFTDEVAAESFADYIASVGIPCDVVDIWDQVRLERFAIRVQRSRVGDLRKALDLKPVATRLTSSAAQLLAGRLARENVPCYVGGLQNRSQTGPWGFNPQGNSDVPIRETTESGCMVAVPAKFIRAAMRLMNTTQISDEELTKLALAVGPPETPV